jgi:hypothetical protein
MKMNSLNKHARIAGILYLLLIPLGVLGIIYVPNTLYVAGDVTATANNILANEPLFRLSIVSALVTQLVNLAVVLSLYELFKPINKRVAQLMVLFILLAMPIAMLNELNRGAVLLLLKGAEQSTLLVELFLNMHEFGIQIAGIFWGLWLFPMGYLAYKSNDIPKIIGIALMIGCFGYFIDSWLFIQFPDFGVTFAQYTFIGEVLLPLWLLVKGVNVPQWKKHSLTVGTS